MSREITVVSGALDRDAVFRTLSDASEVLRPRDARELYYPYHWFHFKFRSSTWLGESALRLSCFIDSRTRVGATTDAFETEAVVAGDDALLAPKIDVEEAAPLARRYAGYVLRNRRKAFIDVDSEIIEGALVHKPLWVVDCGGPEPSGLRMLVDGISGGFHPLQAR